MGVGIRVGTGAKGVKLIGNRISGFDTAIEVEEGAEVEVHGGSLHDNKVGLSAAKGSTVGLHGVNLDNLVDGLLHVEATVEWFDTVTPKVQFFLEGLDTKLPPAVKADAARLAKGSIKSRAQAMLRIARTMREVATLPGDVREAWGYVLAFFQTLP